MKIVMPEEGSYVSFNNHNRSMKVPFVVYADFECFVEKIDTCRRDPSKAYTIQQQKHTPSGFCYKIKCDDEAV